MAGRRSGGPDQARKRSGGASGGRETAAERQERFRQQRAKDGRRRMEVFVSEETPAAIDALRRDQEGRGEVIDRLVRERMD